MGINTTTAMIAGAARVRLLPLVMGLALLASSSAAGSAQDLPTVTFQNGYGQLLLHGKPFLIRGGELGNSSAGTAAQADATLPRLAAMHINTVLMPVAWETIEPSENHFDFSVPDHWIAIARQQNLHLVLLWFGSWKNAFSEYVPGWVKSDTLRFPRAIGADGLPTEILSTLGEETARRDAAAFARLMRHLREMDQREQTVLMVQVENEVGFLGVGGRDRSARANRIFQDPVPASLKRKLETAGSHLSPELHDCFHPAGHTWTEVFSDVADEVFMAWHYALFINRVAEAGRHEYPLPLFANSQLPAPLERAGEYPSGGSHPYYLDVYCAAAPAITFYAPDIYWPDFEYWVQRYRKAGNPVFVPEARLETSPYTSLYAYGEARAFGFSPFGIDSMQAAHAGSQTKPTIAEVYEAMESLNDAILQAQKAGECRALVLHATSPRPTRTVALGGYLFEASLARGWPARELLTNDGAMMVLQIKPDEFLIMGSGLTVTFARDPDRDDRVAGIAHVEQGSQTGGSWHAERLLNGDQTNQGRQLSMAAHQIEIYHVVLYNYQRSQSQ